MAEAAAAEESANVDELLAGLTSLGFEFEDCQQAVQAGNNSLESAVEWLMQKKANPDCTDEDELMPSSQLAGASSSQPSSPHLSEADSKPPTSPETEKVSSRIQTSEEQRRVREQYEQKEREAIRLDAKRRKMMDKKARQQVLQQIADDRHFAKCKAPTREASPASCHSAAATPMAASPQISQCVLQLRFPSGLVKKESFHADSTLGDVIAFACQNYPVTQTDVQLIQPFPRREFTDSSATLQELGLVPGGAIVVQRRKPPPSSGSAPGCHPSNEAGISLGDGSNNPARPADSARMENRGRVEEVQGEDGQGIQLPGVGAPLGGPLPNHGGMINAGNLGLVRQVNHVWGEGVKLGEVEHNPHAIDPVPKATSAGDSAIKRLERRLRPHHHEGGPSGESSSSHTLHRVVETLVGLCVSHVCHRLSGHGLPIVSLGGLPHTICDKVLAQLMKSKTLTPKTLQPFLPCCLTYLKLDCYLLVTNELLTALRLHQHITHLSLRSCPIITDKALHAVAGLRRLKSLNVNQCSQLTDKSFHYIKDIPFLTVLQMDGTKVTDEGVCLFLESSSCCGGLLTLSLCGTHITDRSLSAMKVLKALKILELENTKMNSLDVINYLPLLGSLNISRTIISDSSLNALQGHAELRSLNLLSTNVTDEGLRHLQGLRLSTLKLPNRLGITDEGLKYIQDLPLVSLDLSDYIHVTDRGIGYMKSFARTLQRLSLSNTKLTDSGMMALIGLINLEELNLDRTAITDAGCSVLSNFSKLRLLSLSATAISNKFLARGTLTPCKGLARLNLSRTRVSNTGLTHLALPSLNSLNLDWTRVTSDCQLLLTGCPELKSLRTNNCSAPDVESPDESEEEP